MKKIVIGLSVLLCVFLLTNNAISAQGGKKYILPDDFQGKQCTLLCNQNKYLCKLVSYEHAKAGMKALAESSLELDELLCSSEYAMCYKECGGKIIE